MEKTRKRNIKKARLVRVFDYSKYPNGSGFMEKFDGFEVNKENVSIYRIKNSGGIDLVKDWTKLVSRRNVKKRF